MAPCRSDHYRCCHGVRWISNFVKKFFQWQQQNHAQSPSSGVEHVTRLSSDTVDRALRLLRSAKPGDTLCFMNDSYRKDLQDTYRDSIPDIENMFDDPLTQRMAKIPSYVSYGLSEELRQQLALLLADEIGCGTVTSLTYTVQLPGHMVPLHYDRFKHELSHEPKRWLIFLANQMPGQTFMLDDQPVRWQKGTVISWNHIAHHHGGGNWGYWPRPVINILGAESKHRPLV